MKSYQLIHQLINLLEQLEEENQGKEVSIQDFTGFLLNKVGDPAGDLVKGQWEPVKNESAPLKMAHQLENNIGRLFVFLNRYAKIYIKKTLEGTLLLTAEDFTALAILRNYDHLSKSELINYNLQEKTSGTEVIRRLIAGELVRQWDDVKDKRSKHIAITDKGKALLYEVFTDMTHVSKMITGNLTTAEKLTLQHLLQKLESFHLDHYEKKTLVTKADIKLFTESNFTIKMSKALILNSIDTDRIIEMAWEDRTPFDAIKLQFDATEQQVIALMRREMKLSSFKLWRKRVQGRATKHQQLVDVTLTRFKCSRQKQITLNKISKRR